MSKTVYQMIAEASAELAKAGISKDRNNQQQGYKFRGIDDVYNAIAPIISRIGLVIIPRVLNRTCSERASARGGILFYVTVEAEFDFISSEDGSMHTARTFGEAMDSADKATNKAMSAAYKYAAFQTFCIPTEGDNDADATTYQLSDRGGKLAEWLTTEQQANIQTLAEEVGKNVKDICIAYNVQGLHHLNVDQYKAIIARLEKIRKGG